ncbi:MAG: DUF927 domain-containing protein [Gammaproteobacteria bacterium]|nr:DUF927 domain-containing protein [Gammaproteobacteria bacterium]
MQSHTPDHVVGAFRSALAQAGLVYGGEITADGQIHRIQVDGDRDKDSWYVLHLDDLPAGAFGCWKRGISETWCAKPLNTLSNADRARYTSRLGTLQAARAQEEAERHAKARHSAERRWAIAQPAPVTHPYLVRKRIPAHGARLEGENLLVPIRNADGELTSLQAIAPDGTKRFHPGGEVKACYCLLGDIQHSVIIAEGFATASTLHELTGKTVAIAFNAGNLLPVAKRLAAQHPNLSITIAADNDQWTEGNPGLAKGREAAVSVGARLAIPAFTELAGQPTDFNDLYLREGRDAVLAQLAAAGRPSAERTQNIGPYYCRSSGVYYRPEDGGADSRDYWICSALHVDAMTRDAQGANWGLLLRWLDQDGREHRWAMPMAMLKGEGIELRAELLGRGLKIDPSPKARMHLLRYLNACEPESRATSVDGTGWHGNAFVLPNRVIGASDEPVILQSDVTEASPVCEQGSAAEWRQHVGSLCRGNSRLVFAVSCALAAPLLGLIGEESGGFHFRGGSSTGKTTALRVAASVWGGVGYIQRWRATVNGLEAIARTHNDLLLILDELAQVDPHSAGEIAYMLGNGQGKARATRSGSSRKPYRWRLLFLSAGEISLADHMRQAGKQTKAGQEVRLADIGADAGLGLGIFENLHGRADGAALSRELSELTRHCFGAVGCAFLEQLARRSSTLRGQIAERHRAFIQTHCPPGSEGQVLRVAGRFALVAAAGELATELGLTGWDKSEASASSARCFYDWLEGRGGVGNREHRQVLETVNQYIEMYGESRFQDLDDAEAPSPPKRAGFRRKLLNGETELIVLPESFRSELCAGTDPEFTVKVLRATGQLKPAPCGRAQQQVRIPGLGRRRVYVLRTALEDVA